MPQQREPVAQIGGQCLEPTEQAQRRGHLQQHRGRGFQRHRGREMQRRERGHAQGLRIADLVGLRQAQRRRQRQRRGAALAGPHPQGRRGRVHRDDPAAVLQGHRALARPGIERRDKGFQRQVGQMRRHPARRHTRRWRRHSEGGFDGRFSAFARQGLPGRAAAGMAGTTPLRRRRAFRRRPRVAEQVGGGPLAGKGQATAMLHRARSRSPGPA